VQSTSLQPIGSRATLTADRRSFRLEFAEPIAVGTHPLRQLIAMPRNPVLRGADALRPAGRAGTAGFSAIT